MKWITLVIITLFLGRIYGSLESHCPCKHDHDHEPEHHHHHHCPHNHSHGRFPDSFKFCAASSAYQIEGSWNTDGKGLNIWDEWLHDCITRTTDGKNADIACDSYRKWMQDIRLLKQLGIKLYRFSIAWTRILPNGTPTKINQAGINHYLTFIKELKAAGIEPMVTLHHLDLPEYLQKLGGWLNPQMANYFGDYARICFKHFGEHVKLWLTINEPRLTCLQSYGGTSMPPGLNLGGDGIYQCGKVLLLAHATAYHIYHKEFYNYQRGKVSIVIQGIANVAATHSTEDLIATEIADAFDVDWFAHPIYIGDWPQIMKQRVYKRSIMEYYSFSRLPEFTPEELSYVKGTCDFFGLTMHTANLISHKTEAAVGKPDFDNDRGVASSYSTEWKRSSVSSWLYSYPRGMRQVLKNVWTKYNPGEIYITSNGWSTKGSLHDQERIDNIQAYLGNVLDSIEKDRVNVASYCYWSFIDDFEWGSGYTEKFGLVQVDFNSTNRTRTWRDSAYWYQNVCATHCSNEECLH